MPSSSTDPVLVAGATGKQAVLSPEHCSPKEHQSGF